MDNMAPDWSRSPIQRFVYPSPMLQPVPTSFDGAVLLTARSPRPSKNPRSHIAKSYYPLFPGSWDETWQAPLCSNAYIELTKFQGMFRCGARNHVRAAVYRKHASILASCVLPFALLCHNYNAQAVSFMSRACLVLAPFITEPPPKIYIISQANLSSHSNPTVHFLGDPPQLRSLSPS